MKITVPCKQCIMAMADAGVGIAETDWNGLLEVPLSDIPAYEAICPKGHTIRHVFTNPKFELLFESGVLALKDGHYREAISSFAAALERFYEFLMQAPFIEGDLPQVLHGYTNVVVGEYPKLSEVFRDAWKPLSKQSERQFGAFSMLFLLEFGFALPAIDKAFVVSQSLHLGTKENDPTHFRNLVIHQGYVPTREQAIAYGDVINSYVHKMLTAYSMTGKGEQLLRAQYSQYAPYVRPAEGFVPSRTKSIINLERFVSKAVSEPENVKRMPLELYISQL